MATVFHGTAVNLFVNGIRVALAQSFSFNVAVNQFRVDEVGNPESVEVVNSSYAPSGSFSTVVGERASLEEAGLLPIFTRQDFLQTQPVNIDVRDASTDRLIFRIEQAKCSADQVTVTRDQAMGRTVSWQAIRLIRGR